MASASGSDPGGRATSRLGRVLPDVIGFTVEATYDDPPYATLVLAGTRLSLAEQGHAADDRPGVDDGRHPTIRRVDVVLVVEVDDARAEHARCSSGRAVPGRALRAALGRLPVLLRRPRRLPRRDRAAGMKAVVLAGVGDVRVESVADPAIQQPDRRDRRGARDRDLRRGPVPVPRHDAGLRGRHGARSRVRRRRRRGRLRVRELRVGQRVVNTSMISDGTCPSCAAGRVDAVRGTLAVRLLGRLPEARRRPGRAGARAERGPLPARAAGQRLRRGGGVPGGHPAHRLRLGRPRAASVPSSTRRRRRLRPGRADGDPLRGRRRTARDRGRRHRRAPRRSPRCSEPRPSSRPRRQAPSPRRPGAWARTS